MATAQKFPPFTGYQKFVIAVLAFLQFTIILDFMILSPLGAMIMPTLQINPSQWGLVVSIYAFSAGTSGILSSGFADKYDRKKMLMFFYSGFVLGTLLCGLAPNYHFLLFARMITGIFGGVIGSIVSAITTDLFAYQQRGRVMGIIQTAFAASQILGLPAGLYFSNMWDWHAPFLMIVGISIVAGVVIWKSLRPINEHLKLKQEATAIRHFSNTVSNRKYRIAFFGMAFMSIGGFMIMPFSSAFTVNNVGISTHDLPIIYLVTGIVSIIVGPLIGRAADRMGKIKVFIAGSIVSAIAVVIYTNLGHTPLIGVLAVNAIMFTGIFSRMIPATALISAIPDPAHRGSFMSITASLQQISGGIASLIAGLIVVETSGGVLEHFNTLGYVMLGTIAIAMIIMIRINRQVMAMRPA